MPAKILSEKPDGSKEVELGRTHEIKTVKAADVGPYITRIAELKNHVDGAFKHGQTLGRSRVTQPPSPSTLSPHLHVAPTPL